MYFVTGATGMVGNYIMAQLRAAGAKAHAPTRAQFDLSKPETLAAYLADHAFDVFIHLAAETNVDLCETDPAHAFTVNSRATRAIADFCAEHGKPLIYISTSTVFGGISQASFNELDTPMPVNYYGRSKLKGEEFVKEATSRYFIIRSGWMIGGGPEIDKKFVGKTLRMIESGNKSLIAVSDKSGSLTYAKHLADFILKMAKTSDYGTYHYGSGTPCTRYDIAKMLTKRFGNDVEVQPCASTKFPLPAPRPFCEAMTTVNTPVHGQTMPTWERLLEAYLEEWSSAQ